MITLVYVHDHECSRKGEVHKMYPAIENGVFFMPHPMCLETKTELWLSGVK